MEHILSDRIDANGPLPRQSRRLRLGVIGGGKIAQTQGMAARLSDWWKIVAGALSSDPVPSRDRVSEWHVDPARARISFEEMAKAEVQRRDATDAVMITTPNNMYFSATKVFLEAGFDVILTKH